MTPSARSLVLGRSVSRRDRFVDAALVVLAGLVSFVAYALDVFTVSGGVVVVPGDATLLGIVVAALVGYRGTGLLLGWLAAFAPLFAFGAEWGLLGLSGHDLAGKLAFVFDPTSLVVYGVTAAIVGGVGYSTGSLFRLDLAALRGELT